MPESRFKETPAADIEALVRELKTAQGDNVDFVALPSSVHKKVDQALEFILHKDLGTWEKSDMELYRAWISYPGRREYQKFYEQIFFYENHIEGMVKLIGKVYEIDSKLGALGNIANAQTNAQNAQVAASKMAGLRAAQQLGGML